MSNEQAKPKSIGGLWARTSAKGTDFFSGSIEIEGVKHEFLAFKNNFKEDGDKKPDYTLQLSVPREQSAPAPQANRKPPAQGAAPQRQAPQQARGVNPQPQRAPMQKPPQQKRQAPVEDTGDEDVPF